MTTGTLDLTPEPDLNPLYPSTVQIALQLSSHSGLAPEQKSRLVGHCLSRACVFGELSVLQYLLSDPQAQPYVDLGIQDEDGLGLVSLTIHGFGAESDRDVEREECARLLIIQGADLKPDKAGWTPLHHAALLSPPTLVSFLMTHGCSAFDVTHRNLTPLDIVTAHSMLPGRDDVALLLEETMRGEGWQGGRMEQNRRQFDERVKRRGKQRDIRDNVGQVLNLSPRWWGQEPDQSASDSDSDSDSEREEIDDSLYTPPVDYASMLVFSPALLPQIFESLIINFPPSVREARPANSLYMLARFACLTCDHTWLEELVVGAAEAIEDTFFNRGEDVATLVFWLYNLTVWLHLMQCDKSINEACEMLGSFELLEEVINSVFVFIIRFAERRIDQLLDSAILDYSPVGPGVDTPQFESEWSFLRTFTGKRKSPALPSTPISGVPSSPPSPASSPPPSNKGFSSLRQSVAARARGSSTAKPLQSLFPGSTTHPPPPTNSSQNLLSFLTALHSFLTLSDINPAFTTQLWSQVMYWTSCEIFNRALTRKKYICRSKAVQIASNLAALEEWVIEMGLPRGVQLHFTPVKDLLHWLQCLSSVSDFSSLVATIQQLKSINPLQMRRALRDYKYEINEGRMTEECVQYLTQLQKDWERQRVKLGVEALRKEMTDRDRDRDGSVSSLINETQDVESIMSVSSSGAISTSSQTNIDLLFDHERRQSWEPPKPPQVLGELLDSRHMLPLNFPSDPRMLAVLPAKLSVPDDDRRPSPAVTPGLQSSHRPHGPQSTAWRSRNRRLREVGVSTLKSVDGRLAVTRWSPPIPDEVEEGNGVAGEESTLQVDTRDIPFTRNPAGRTRGRPSMGDDQTTPV